MSIEAKEDERMGAVRTGWYEVGMMPTNFYYLYGAVPGEAMVFDPADHGREIFEQLQKEGLTVRAVILTHGHFDHIGGVEELRRLSGAKVYAPEAERNLLSDPEANLSLEFGRAITVGPDVWVKDGEVIEAAGISVRTIHTPGHTEGSCCYYMENGAQHPVLIAGDTLFEGSVGRTDFPTGSMSLLVRSLTEKLAELPDDTEVYPGHGGLTSLGEEKRNNPYFHMTGEIR